MNYNSLLIDIDDVLKQIDDHHNKYDKEKIRKADLIAGMVLSGVKRRTGEACIMHSRRVALTLAKWGCNAEWVCAGLMHEIGDEIKEYAYYFGGEIISFIEDSKKIEEGKLTLETLSDDKKSIENAAGFYIEFASRLDDLTTIEGLSDEERTLLAQDTKDNIIPLASFWGAEKITSDLEDLCFPIFHPSEDNRINTAFAEYKRSKLLGFSKTIATIKDILLSSDQNTQREHISSTEGHKRDLKVSKRANVSIYRQLMFESENINVDLDKYLTNKTIAWYDITFILSDSSKAKNSTATDIFYRYYAEKLLENNIFIIKTCITTRKDSKYILMCDSVGNIFRLFIKSMVEYHLYEIGNIAALDSFSFPDPKDSSTKRIKVFKRNGAACWLDAGATVLDFAFSIHSEVGLRFDYATINGSSAHHEAHHRLNYGDIVNIKTKETETAEIRWFRYLKTPEAVEKLCKFYSDSQNLKAAYEAALEKEKEKRERELSTS